MEYDWATFALYKSYYSSLCGRRRLCEEESLRLSYRMNNRLLTVCTEDGTGWANCWGWSKEAQDSRVGQGLAEGMLRKGEEVPG